MKRIITTIGIILILASISYATVIDNFNDGDWENNPTWEELVGSNWTAASNYLTTTESGDRIFLTLDANIDASAIVTLQADYYQNGNSVGGFCKFQASNSDYSGNGYGFFHDSGTMHFIKSGGGTWVDLVDGGDITEDAWHTLRAERDATGGWTFYIDDVNKGTAEDNTYQNFGTVLVGYNSASGVPRFDNIEYSTAGAAATITPEIIIPNGGEEWSLATGTKTIDFNITTILDINDIIIDLNYSASATQGTGTEIIEDKNIGIQGLNCDTNTSTTHACHYDWNYSTVTAGNYYILLFADTNSGTGGYDAGNATFEITTPLIQFWLDDENGTTKLENVTITDGIQTRTTNAQGYTNFDLNYYATTTTATFTLTKTGYGTRYYEIDVNSETSEDINFAMLQTTEDYAANVELEVWNDSGNLVTNTYVKVQKDGEITVGRRKTNSTGKATFYLQEFDTNYNFLIEESTQWDTNLGIIQVNRPKTEGTTTDIDGNWATEIKATTQYPTQKIQTNSWSILIIPNTARTYNFTIYMLTTPAADQNIDDTNQDTTYGQRTYATRIRGDVDGETHIIQPYLKAGLTLTPITVLEQFTEILLARSIVRIYRAEGDTYPVTSCETDDLGRCLVYLNTEEEYYYEVEDSDFLSRTINGALKGIYYTVNGVVTVVADIAQVITTNYPQVAVISHKGTIEKDSRQ